MFNWVFRIISNCRVRTRSWVTRLESYARRRTTWPKSSPNTSTNAPYHPPPRPQRHLAGSILHTRPGIHRSQPPLWRHQRREVWLAQRVSPSSRRQPGPLPPLLWSQLRLLWRHFRTRLRSGRRRRRTWPDSGDSRGRQRRGQPEVGAMTVMTFRQRPICFSNGGHNCGSFRKLITLSPRVYTTVG